jgi:hypothetical protein
MPAQFAEHGGDLAVPAGSTIPQPQREARETGPCQRTQEIPDMFEAHDFQDKGLIKIASGVSVHGAAPHGGEGAAARHRGHVRAARGPRHGPASRETRRDQERGQQRVGKPVY